MSDDPHVVKLLALLGQIPQDVHDGVVPAGAERPYALAYFTTETLTQSSLTGLSDVVTTTAYVHCVGGSASAARKVATAVDGVLLNARPDIPGRRPGIVRQAQALPPHRDETTGELVMDAVLIYTLTTEPA